MVYNGLKMRRKRRTKTVSKLLLLPFILIVLGGSFNYLRPLPAPALSRTQITSQLGTVSLDWPSDGSIAAIGAVGYGVLASNGSSQFPTASTAKLITALTVLKKMPLQLNETGPTITITSNDVNIYNNYLSQDGSVTKVVVGEQISEYQALQALLLPSADNIADTLAIWAFGSLQNYQLNATQEIQSLGLSNTVVGTDASGLSPTTLSTPSDLVLLGSAALQNPVIAQIVGQTSADLPNIGTVYNVNSLLGRDGIDGIKTGNSDQAGGVYLFSAPVEIGSQTVTIVGAIVHSPNLNSATGSSINLLDSAKKGFTYQTPIVAGQKYGSYSTVWGAKATVIAKNNISLPVWDGVLLQPHVTFDNNVKPGVAGDIVGTVSVSSGTYHTSSPIILGQNLNNPTFWWRLTRH